MDNIIGVNSRKIIILVPKPVGAVCNRTETLTAAGEDCILAFP
ncbi:MAG: hypothetical protein OYL97_12835 [Candidatus Poribacteria bacterium]|nr:hypothetical protein [Candidatus Poribacteria bacterium]MDE0467932.1 hypothetical protein [Candidatus Poribacteria bacterium]